MKKEQQDNLPIDRQYTVLSLRPFWSLIRHHHSNW